MPSEERDRDLRESRRSSVAVEVGLQFSDSEEMVVVTANLSRGGMFVPLRPPRPVGTLMRLAISLPDFDEEVRGYGEVVWIRVRDESSDRPAGMGIQFRHLDGEGADLLSQRLPSLEVAAERQRMEPATPASEEGAGALPPFPPGPPPGGRGAELPSPSAWEEAPPEGPRDWPPEASPAAGGWSSSGEAAHQPEEEETGQSSPRRLSKTMVVASVGLLVVAVAAFFLREPLVQWLAGGPETTTGLGDGGVEARTTAPEAPAGEEVPREPQEGGGEEAVPAGEAASPTGEEAPVAAGPAAALPEPAPVSPAGPLSEIQEIAWWGVEGETLVVITGDGAIPREQVTHQRVGGGRPRELLRIAGVTRPYRQAEIPVGTPEVTRIRTGHHPESAGGELYVVFDLASPRAAVDRIETLATGIRVYLRKSGS